MTKDEAIDNMNEAQEKGIKEKQKQINCLESVNKRLQ